MLAVESLHRCNPDVEQRITRHIQMRTGGRLRQLQFEEKENRLLIHGVASSYYIKQLALAAIVDVMGPATSAEVVVNIEVSKPSPRWGTA